MYYIHYVFMGDWGLCGTGACTTITFFFWIELILTYLLTYWIKGLACFESWNEWSGRTLFGTVEDDVLSLLWSRYIQVLVISTIRDHYIDI